MESISFLPKQIKMNPKPGYATYNIRTDKKRGVEVLTISFDPTFLDVNKIRVGERIEFRTGIVDNCRVIKIAKNDYGFMVTKSKASVMPKIVGVLPEGFGFEKRKAATYVRLFLI